VKTRKRSFLPADSIAHACLGVKAMIPAKKKLNLLDVLTTNLQSNYLDCMMSRGRRCSLMIYAVSGSYYRLHPADFCHH
jgi:hypothetical protein